MMHDAATPTRTLKRAVPFVLAGCTAVSVLSTDLITPSIPDLPQVFGTSINTAQMVVSVNLAAYALAQLVHGPVADAIGRKRLLVLAFLGFAGVSLVCATAPSIEALLVGRFAQGLLSSVPSVVIVLMIRELYAPRQALRVMSLYGAALGLAPAIGPLVGGYLHVWYGWWAGFLFIAALALVAAGALWVLVPESLQVRAPLNARGVMHAYRALLGNRRYLALTLGTSLCFGALYAYVTAAPSVYIDLLGLKTQQYGLTHVVIVIAFILGNLGAAVLSQRFGSGRVLQGGAVVMILAAILLLGPVWAGGPSVVKLLLPMVIYAAGLAVVLAAGPLVTLNAARHQPQGPAAALLGSMQLAMGALAGYLSARFYDDTALPMAMVVAGVLVLGAGLILSVPAAPGSARAD